MAYTIPTSPPDVVEIGSSWFWDVTYPDFPASEGWELSLYVRGASDLDVAFGSGIEAAASGPAFEVRITAATTAALTVAGGHRLLGRVSKGEESHLVENRHLLILADPSDAVAAKSHNRQMLEAIEAALVAGVSDSTEIKSVSVNGRAVTYRDRAELEKARSHYALLVAIENNPQGTVTHATEFVRG